MSLSELSKDFIFGASTSAYQIEGAVQTDGRGASIWDDFCRQRGRIRFGHSGETACDHYHRYREDVQLMRRLNLDAYRFSIAWSRILPEGSGRVNEAGLDFYKRLTDSLLEAGIRPFATLYHWDMPSALYRSKGGFRHRDVCEIFADYVSIVLKGLGDRVQDWITLNEPFEHAAFGHLLGSHAPGRHSMKDFLKVMHHQLLGHGAAMERIRNLAPKARAGITLSLTPIFPASNSPRDAWAANLGNQLLNYITLDALYKQRYPQELSERLRWFWPKIEPGDMRRIALDTDFLGVNHYNCEYARYRWYIPFLKSWISGARPAESEFERDGRRYTSMGWEVYPPGMTKVLRLLREDYGNPPVYITENGAAFDDVVSTGEVHDPKRIDYLRDYLHKVAGARQAGSRLLGYFAWSLLDNFEWSTGYSKRFGLIYTDYKTQERIIKSSGHWYAQLISNLKRQRSAA